MLLPVRVSSNSQVVTCAVDCKSNAAGCAVSGHQELVNVHLAWLLIPFFKGVSGVENVDKNNPRGLRTFWDVHDQVVIAANQPGGVLRALQVASEPIEVFCDARQHISARSPPPMCLYCRHLVTNLPPASLLAERPASDRPDSPRRPCLEE